MLVLNSAYILAVKPYLDLENSTLDKVNSFFLISLCVVVSTYSSWNSNTNDRFIYGIIFDVLVVLQFLVNMAYVLGQVVSSIILKVK